MSRPPISPSVLEAIQALVNTGSPAKSRAVLEARADDLLSEAADFVLRAELEDRKRKGAEQSICALESWRALVVRCRRDGIQAAFEWQALQDRVDVALGALGLSSGRPIRLIGEADPLKISPADAAMRAALMAGFFRPALTFLDVETQPISLAILQAELAHALSQSIAQLEAPALAEVIELAQAAIPILEAVDLRGRLTKAQNALGLASLQRYTLSGAADDLEVGLAAAQQAGWLFISEYRKTHDELNLNFALDVFRRALAAAPRGAPDWPRHSYNVGLAYHFRFSAYRIRAPLGDAFRAKVPVNSSDLDQAITAMADAVAASPLDTPDRRLFQSDLALVQWERFELFGQLDDLNAALQGSQAILDVTEPTDPEWGDRRGKLGIKLHSRFLHTWNLRDLEDSTAAIQDALDGSPPATEDWARWQSNLGVALRTWFRVRGDIASLDAAIEALRQSLTVTTAEPASQSLRHYNLGLAFLSRFELTSQVGNVSEAIAAFEKGSQSLSPRSKDWVSIQADLGVAYRRRFEVLGDPQDIKHAISHLHSAIGAAEPGLTGRARWMVNLGNSLSLQFFITGAESDLDNALDLIREGTALMQPGSAEWATAQTDLGTAFKQRFARTGSQTDLDQATQAYQLAMAAFEPDQWPEQILLTGRLLGDVQFSQGAWRESAEAFAKAAQALELLYQRQLLTAGREGWLARQGHLQQHLAYALAQAGDLPGSVLALERGRARSLGDTLDRDRIDLERARLAEPEAYALYQQACVNLRQLAALERAEVLATDSRQAQLASQALRDQTRAAQADLNSAVVRIRQIQGYEDFLAPPTIDDIARAAQNEPLVYLVTTPAGSLGLVVRHLAPGLEVQIEPIWCSEFSQAELMTLLGDHSGSDRAGGYLAGQMGDTTRLKTVLTHGLPVLGERLLKPITAYIKRLAAAGLILIPSGYLTLLPLHAASEEGSGQALLDPLDVTYAPSARVLLAARAALAAKAGSPISLMGIGNPLPNPRPLAFGQMELEDIAPLFERATALYGEAATKSAALESLPKASHLHFACHASFDIEHPLKSALALSGSDRLTLDEILSQPVFSATRLVVLSACQTAITDFSKLPDEAVGLPAGFMQANVPGVVGTLWSVNDLSTALLMVQFYKYHLEDGLTPVRALGQAQRWLRTVTNEELTVLFDSYRRPPAHQPVARMGSEMAQSKFSEYARADQPKASPFEHPIYWAPFVYYGV